MAHSAGFSKGGQCPQLLSSTRHESAIWLRIAMLTSKDTMRFYRPWISRAGAWIPTRLPCSRATAYANIRSNSFPHSALMGLVVYYPASGGSSAASS